MKINQIWYRDGMNIGKPISKLNISKGGPFKKYQALQNTNMNIFVHLRLFQVSQLPSLFFV